LAQGSSCSARRIRALRARAFPMATRALAGTAAAAAQRSRGGALSLVAAAQRVCRVDASAFSLFATSKASPPWLCRGPSSLAGHARDNATPSRRRLASCSEGALAELPFSFTLADPSLKDCPLIGCSAGFTELTGYTTQEIVGRSCRFLLQGVPEDCISFQMRERARDFCSAVAAGRKYVASEEHSKQWLLKMPEGQVPIAQMNARKDGALFLSLFLLRQVEFQGRSLILAVQVGIGERPATTARCQGILKCLDTGAPLLPDDRGLCDQAMMRLVRNMAAAVRTLGTMIPKLHGSGYVREEGGGGLDCLATAEPPPLGAWEEDSRLMRESAAQKLLQL